MYKRATVAFLAGFYPAMFFLSNNWQIFSIYQSVILVLGTALLSLIILYGMSYLFDIIFRSFYKKLPEIKTASLKPGAFFDATLTFFAILLCMYLLRNTLALLEVQKVLLYIAITLIVAYSTWYSFKRGVTLIHSALVILSLVSIAGYFINVYTESSLPIETWSTRNKPIYDRIKLKQTPNIYLIVAESYPNKAALKAVYDIDNSRFYKKMEDLGLKINHNYFSNYNHTLSSLPSLFAMEHHYGFINLDSFDSFGGRRMLEASAYNPVLDILRANNYRIQYLHDTNALIPDGANIDFCFPTPSLLHGINVFLKEQSIISETPYSRKRPEILASIRKRIEISSHQNEHFFSFIYLSYPGHFPSRTKFHTADEINKKLATFRKNYNQNIKKANQDLIGLIELITTNDPDAIIIIIGDHGSWGYRYQQDAQGNFISHQLFVLDRFGVLAGIRAPYALSSLMEKGTIKSHVNLFKYVFAYLSGDEGILETKADDNSFDGLLVLAIKNGVILKDYIKLERVR